MENLPEPLRLQIDTELQRRGTQIRNMAAYSALAKAFGSTIEALYAAFTGGDAAIDQLRRDETLYFLAQKLIEIDEKLEAKSIQEHSFSNSEYKSVADNLTEENVAVELEVGEGHRISMDQVKILAKGGRRTTAMRLKAVNTNGVTLIMCSCGQPNMIMGDIQGAVCARCHRPLDSLPI